MLAAPGPATGKVQAQAASAPTPHPWCQEINPRQCSGVDAPPNEFFSEMAAEPLGGLR